MDSLYNIYDIGNYSLKKHILDHDYDELIKLYEEQYKTLIETLSVKQEEKPKKLDISDISIIDF